MEQNNFRLVNVFKIISLSILLGIFSFLAAKIFVSPASVDEHYFLCAVYWYIFLFLPLSIFLFSKSRVLKIMASIFGVIGIIFIIGGVMFYVSDSSAINDGLFGSIYGAPTMVLIYTILLSSATF